jgi:hypothetical protein
LTPPPQEGETVRWGTAEQRTGDIPSSGSAEPGAHWAPVPESLNKARKLKSLEKSFNEYLYTSVRLVLLENAKLGLVSEPGEDVMAFRARLQRTAQQEAEKTIAVEKLKYEAKFAALGVPMPQGVVREEESLLDVINPLSWFRSAPKPGEKDKVNKLHSEWLTKRAEIIEKWRKLGEEYSENTLAPRRADVQVTQFGLAWVPFWESANGERVAAYHLAPTQPAP